MPLPFSVSVRQSILLQLGTGASARFAGFCAPQQSLPHCSGQGRRVSVLTLQRKRDHTLYSSCKGRGTVLCTVHAKRESVFSAQFMQRERERPYSALFMQRERQARETVLCTVLANRERPYSAQFMQRQRGRTLHTSCKGRETVLCTVRAKGKKPYSVQFMQRERNRTLNSPCKETKTVICTGHTETRNSRKKEQACGHRVST